MMNRFFFWMSLAAGIGAGVTASAAAENESARPSASFTNLFSDKVVARAKGFEVKQSQVDAAFTAYKASLTSRGKTLPETQRSMVESNLIERLMVVQLLMSKATDDEKKRAQERASVMYKPIPHRRSCRCHVRPAVAGHGLKQSTTAGSDS